MCRLRHLCGRVMVQGVVWKLPVGLSCYDPVSHARTACRRQLCTVCMPANPGLQLTFKPGPRLPCPPGEDGKVAGGGGARCASMIPRPHVPCA